jgi:hypothetical protein
MKLSNCCFVQSAFYRREYYSLENVLINFVANLVLLAVDNDSNECLNDGLFVILLCVQEICALFFPFCRNTPLLKRLTSDTRVGVFLCRSVESKPVN